ncbi:pilus assembly PilX N-terminal domain-containing protein [Janthinobacterium sp.]|uniref:pilus assembly PilX N-terminal domain-containing protein n=1 Tax=Janthinobacterium sp. TaxID=1871054 RepID=UPI00293D72EE|nr:pilus assembly PilX N-terminal domain-containing protein [Janthinobacterium sp.]
MRAPRIDLVRRRGRGAGFGLVTAIFLLVVLAGMGVAMVTLSTAQQAGASLDLLGARAYQAARAGIEYGLYRQRRSGVCTGPVGFERLVMPAGTSLSNFSVIVVCTPTTSGSVNPNGVKLFVYQVKATACNLPDANGACPNWSNNADYVQRVLSVQFEAP